MFQICGDVEAVGFPGQNVYKMMYGDENATFERLLVFYQFFCMRSRSLTRFHVVKVIGPIDCCSIQNRNPRPPPNSGIFDGRGSLLGKR